MSLMHIYRWSFVTGQGQIFENSPFVGAWCFTSTFLFFSSPEHNVRRPSVCPSICPSVNNFFKNLLLLNQKANLDKTWQECSLGEALQKLLKEFNSNKNSGCHGNKMAENGKKSLKIFL